MEVDQIQCKFQKNINGDGKFASTKIGKINQKMDNQYPEEEEGEHRRATPNDGVGGGVGGFYIWPSSRIVRVSRASGGKDRHSKVLTSKGPRDRRVRLSVNTAIQFYDLQDRLGYDQPSKAVEWLLKAAASSIAELPPMSSPFPDTPKQMSDEKRSSTTAGNFDSVEVDMDGRGGRGGGGGPADPSSTSETSKGSSRSDTRIKARERARVKGKENESSHNPSFNPINQTTSFTELLSGGINHDNSSINGRQWSTTSSPMDYFSNGGLLGPPSTVAAGDHHFSFAPDHYGTAAGGNNNHNLNFTISSANSAGVFTGYNRGTLQSNSSSPSLLRFSPADGSHQNVFIGGGGSAPVENHHHHHHQFLSEFDARLQLYYGDAHGNNGRHNAGHKGKGKN